MQKKLTKKEYLKFFSSSEVKKEALKQALDIRKFEIELYWKRTAYFWTLITAMFAGYFLIQNSDNTTKEQMGILISSIGFVFSFGWYLSNRGSKFWQVNWERHVDLLENGIMGDLYKIVIHDDKKRNFLGFLIDEKSYSVSKINQILSFFVVSIWFLLILQNFNHYFKLEIFQNYMYLFGIVILFLTIIFICSMLNLARSSNEIEDDDSITIMHR